MEQASSELTVRYGPVVGRLPAEKLRFSAHKCIAFDQGESDRQALGKMAELLAARGDGLAFYGNGKLLAYFFEQAPSVKAHVKLILTDDASAAPAEIDGIPVRAVAELPDYITTVFLCETGTLARWVMRENLPERVGVVSLDDMQELASEAIPDRAWIPELGSIYPLDLPRLEIRPGLDMLLADVPARNLALMPNGLGYVHNTLKKTSINFQTFDFDIIVYHRFHIRRIFDEGGKIVLPSGRELPIDPWQAEHYDLWSNDEVHEYFTPEVDEIIACIVKANPKMLGLSVQGCNERFSRRVLQGVQAKCPDILILAGGFSCYNPDTAMHNVPEADYICIGEADLTVGPLVEALAVGERPFNQPGIRSKFDTPDWQYIAAPMPHDLDKIDFPTYEWFGVNLYRNYNNYQLTPVIASRGCRWSRCTFCAERFFWRIRTPKAFVDELQWLVDNGCNLFMFNESDLNGLPEVVYEICEEILRRGIKVKLTGQLRIHKKSDSRFFAKLAEAGFVALRFGVDAFSENTLRLQKKGYTTEMVYQNLKDCWESGIYTEVNYVIGVPGETEENVQESIDLLIKCRPYIGRMANINPLILSNGSVYWIEPEKHNIHFREPKEELYKKFPRALPATLWYSTEPYIDEKVRKAWFEETVVALNDNGFDLGTWAAKIIDMVRNNKDGARGSLEPQKSAESKTAQGAPEAAVSNHAAPETNVEDANACGCESKQEADETNHKVIPIQVARDQRDQAEREESAVEEEHTVEYASGANPNQRRPAGYEIRAGSNMLAPDVLPELEARLFIVRHGGAYYGVAREHINAFHNQAAAALGEVKTITAADINILSIRNNLSALPEFIAPMLGYNIIRMDSIYFGIPHALGELDLTTDDITGLPGVIIDKSYKTVEDRIKEITATQGLHSSVRSAFANASQSVEREMAHLTTSLEGYNLYYYQGRYYGLPVADDTMDWDVQDMRRVRGTIKEGSLGALKVEIKKRTATQNQMTAA